MTVEGNRNNDNICTSAASDCATKSVPNIRRSHTVVMGPVPNVPVYKYPLILSLVFSFWSLAASLCHLSHSHFLFVLFRHITIFLTFPKIANFFIMTYCNEQTLKVTTTNTTIWNLMKAENIKIFLAYLRNLWAHGRFDYAKAKLDVTDNEGATPLVRKL